MSIRTLLWAKEQTVITSSQRRKNGKLVTSKPAPNTLDKLVLIGIGDEASEHSWDALIGIEDLAVFGGCTRRAVQESLGRLERAGYIRCRHTKVESGQSGWRRIYLLSAESPLFRGAIEVDFDSVEQISRYQMRTFTDRHKSEFVPSDSLRHRREKPPQEQGERGSPWPESRVNEVHPAGVNEVRTEGERGSPCGGERGSHPFFSPSEFFSPDPESGRTEEAAPDSEGDEHHQVATELVGRLRERGEFARVGAYESQVWQVRDDVAGALAAGHSPVATEAYLVAKLATARTVKFVRDAFAPSRLPDIAGYAPAPTAPEVAMPEWCGRCDDEGQDKPNLRRIEIDGAMRPCPDCHPKAAADR